MKRSGRVDGACATAPANSSSVRPTSAGSRASLVAAERGVELAQPLVLAQERCEKSPDRDLRAVRSAPWVERVDRMGDLVARPAARPAAPGRRHGQPAEDERLGERRQVRVREEVVRPVEERFGAGAGKRGRETVHRLAALSPGELPVGERAQVAECVADPGAQLLRRAAAHVVEVDDDGDRDVDAVRALATVVLERGDGRCDAVVCEVGRHRDHGQAGEARRVLGDVDGAAAADSDHGVEGAGAKTVGELERRPDRAALDGEGLGVLERRPDGRNDLVALARPDDDGDVPVRGDALVAEQGDERVDGPAADVDRERARDHAG